MITNNCAARIRHNGSLLQLVLGAKWALEVIEALVPGPLRRRELWPAITDSPPSQAGASTDRKRVDPLDRTLDRLVKSGLVIRSEEKGVFPRCVVYTLVPGVADVLDLVGPLVVWMDRFESERRDRMRESRRSA